MKRIDAGLRTVDQVANAHLSRRLVDLVDAVDLSITTVQDDADINQATAERLPDRKVRAVDGAEISVKAEISSKVDFTAGISKKRLAAIVGAGSVLLLGLLRLDPDRWEVLVELAREVFLAQ